MNLPPNVDKTDNHYIVYDAEGFAFRGVQIAPLRWRARPSHASAHLDNREFSARTLRALAFKLSNSKGTK